MEILHAGGVSSRRLNDFVSDLGSQRDSGCGGFMWLKGLGLKIVGYRILVIGVL